MLGTDAPLLTIINPRDSCLKTASDPVSETRLIASINYPFNNCVVTA
jgi:hypothetical protein